MSQYIAKRILLNVPVIFLVFTLVFLAGHVRPGFAEQRAAQGVLGGRNYEEAVATIRAELGTDKPFWKQYVFYLRDILKGDLGRSWITHRTVLGEIKHRAGPSVELGLLQLVVALLVSVPVGVISAVRQD